MDDDDEHDAGDDDGDDDVFGVIKISWHETLISLVGLLVDCPLCNNSRHGGGDSAQRKWIRRSPPGVQLCGTTTNALEILSLSFANP